MQVEENTGTLKDSWEEGTGKLHWGEVWALYPKLFAVGISLAPLPSPLSPLPWHGPYVHMPLLLVLPLICWVTKYE